jgi:hypothetical protein
MRSAGTLVCTLVAVVGCGSGAPGPRTDLDANADVAAPTDGGPEAAGPDVTAEATAAEVPADPATWSHIYVTLLHDMSYASNCTGEGCHDPGIQKGLDLSSQENGYVSVQAKLVPGDPEGSTIVMKLESGEMPRTRPSMPAADLALIKAWIAAGAPND